MNRHMLSIIIFMLFPTIAVFGQNKVTKTFTVGGTTHSCIWYAPSGISKPPVVFFVHGANGSGGGMENDTKGDAVADKEKFIAVYPSASSNGAGGTWSDMSGTSNFPFFQAVIDTLDARYQIDRNKIYMTGFSQGGFISFVAGCSFSDVFAAVAPVSGHAGSSCKLKRPVPVFLTFGAQEDKTSFVNDINIWLKLDSCPSTPTITRPYPASNPQSKVTRVTYGPCAQGTYVIMDSISGQGHQWPSASNLNQAEEVWAFFKQYSLNGNSTSARQTMFAEPREPVSVSYASGAVHIRGAGEQCRITIIDTRGRQHCAGAATHQQISFNNKQGVYLVLVKHNNRTVAQKILIP
jgi:poly(3-hydroxybutyrate) depolymerase